MTDSDSTKTESDATETDSDSAKTTQHTEPSVDTKDATSAGGGNGYEKDGGGLETLRLAGVKTEVVVLTKECIVLI